MREFRQTEDGTNWEDKDVLRWLALDPHFPPNKESHVKILYFVV
jgi:hypothetical protein